MSIAMLTDAVHKLDELIREEQSNRRAAFKTLFDQIERSVEAEATLWIKRAQAVAEIPPEQRRDDVAVYRRGTLELAPQTADVRGAPAVILEILKSAGPDGLLGPELVGRAINYGLTLAAVDRAKQKLRYRRQIDFDRGTRRWTLLSEEDAATQVAELRAHRKVRDRERAARHSDGEPSSRAA